MVRSTSGLRWSVPLVSFIFLILIVPSTMAAVQTAPPVKQGTCTQLTQLYFNSTFQNISSVQKPDDTFLVLNASMQNRGGGLFNYTFCDTGLIGEYIVNGFGDKDGVRESWNYNFYVTASGFDTTLGFSIIMIIVVYGVMFMGLIFKNEYIAIFGGLLAITLGLYGLNNGFDIYRNNMTDSLSLITLGIGAFVALAAGIAVIEENL